MNKQMQTFDQGRALFDLSQRRILLQSDHPSLPMDPQRNFKNINFTLQKDEFHRGNSFIFLFEYKFKFYTIFIIIPNKSETFILWVCKSNFWSQRHLSTYLLEAFFFFRGPFFPLQFWKELESQCPHGLDIHNCLHMFQ